MEILESAIGEDVSLAGTNQTADFPTVVFEVSDVSRASKPLPEVPYYKAIEALLKEPGADDDDWLYGAEPEKPMVEACSQYRGQLVANIQYHPFFAAIHNAFNDHRPLCFSPDMLWLLISQGLANHINANSEKLRAQFVRHQGKLSIKVRRDDFVKGSPDNPWSEAFAAFSASIRQHIGEATHDLLIPTFSTTGPLERAAAEIVLLDAMQSYFKYEFVTLCGIPEIKLEGTVADWQELLERTKKLAEFGLDWWVNSLVPILEQFVTASQGQPDKLFWQSMYKLDDGSGGPYITGWITAFFPYLKDPQTGKATEPNRLLIEGQEPILTTEAFPSGLAKAPFHWQYFAESYEMEFLGGFVGVRQDANDLCLRPEIGWSIREVGAEETF